MATLFLYEKYTIALDETASPFYNRTRPIKAGEADETMGPVLGTSARAAFGVFL